MGTAFVPLQESLVSFVIPFKDEEETLEKLFRAIGDQVSKITPRWEIIFAGAPTATDLAGREWFTTAPAPTTQPSPTSTGGLPRSTRPLRRQPRKAERLPP